MSVYVKHFRVYCLTSRNLKNRNNLLLCYFLLNSENVHLSKLYNHNFTIILHHIKKKFLIKQIELREREKSSFLF